jgi:hypothetical protein
MDETNVTDVLPPSFGGRLRTENYYTNISNVIRILRGRSSLRVIAMHLNSQGFTTPTGLPFNRDRLARYIKSNTI